MESILFFSEDIDYKLPDPSSTVHWITSIIEEQSYSLVQINYIFCSDEHLLEINQKHLAHNYYTDIITFNNADEEKELEADIFISIDRVQENAAKTNQSFDRELHRVMIHGVLHLVGFDDKTQKDKEEMRRKEDACLSLLDF